MKLKQIKLKGEIQQFTVMVGEINTPVSVRGRTKTQKDSMDIIITESLVCVQLHAKHSHFIIWTTQEAMFCSVQFSHSVVSDSLQSHGLQHARPPCPSSAPGVYPNSCPLSQWCHPTISSSLVPFSSCPQSFLASGSFPVSRFFTSGGQSIGVCTPAPVLPMNTQDWSPSGWTGWISLQSKGLSGVFSNITVEKHQFFSAKLSLRSCSHIHTWLLEKA